MSDESQPERPMPQISRIWPQSENQNFVLDPTGAISAETRRHSDPERPWVYVNMISSLDGATAAEGLSGALGGPSDRAVFSALRAQADAIIVGAQTVRAERYRPPQIKPEHSEQRVLRGQSTRPLIVVVTASGELDPDLPLFGESDYEPLVITGQTANKSGLEKLSGRARIVVQQSPNVELTALVEQLGQEGHRLCLVEGGPNLNGQFIAAGLVDEWNMTMSGSLHSGESSRAAYGPTPEQIQQMELVRLWLAQDLLLGRWVRKGNELDF